MGKLIEGTSEVTRRLVLCTLALSPLALALRTGPRMAGCDARLPMRRSKPYIDGYARGDWEVEEKP